MHGLRALADILPQIVEPSLRRRGLGSGRLVHDWPLLVGSRLAEDTVPERLTFSPRQTSSGTLTVRVRSGAAALELTHQQADIIARITAEYGYPLVARLRLLHGAFDISAAADSRVAASPASVQQSPREAPDLDGIDAVALREILLSLRVASDPEASETIES